MNTLPNRKYKVTEKSKKGTVDEVDHYLQLKYGKCVLKEIKVGSDAEGRASAERYLNGIMEQLNGIWSPRTERDIEKSRA